MGAQGSLAFRQRGGRRRGAGRPAKGARAGSRHQRRAFLDAKYPVHVVLRVEPCIGSLRRCRMYRAIVEATLTAARRERIRIVHVSIQRTHLHLLVEAADSAALSSGMQGFQISAAKHINAALGQDSPGPRRRGRVFVDRYHAEIITSPTQAHRALGYVLCNFRKHREDHAAPARGWRYDWFSSAPLFHDWHEYGQQAWMWRYPPGYEPLLVQRPRTWMLRAGWKLIGPISYRHVPSSRR